MYVTLKLINVFQKTHLHKIGDYEYIILLFTVAVQCLETTFKISSSDYHLAAPQPLREIFLNSLLKVTQFITHQPVFFHYFNDCLVNNASSKISDPLCQSFSSNCCSQNDIVSLPETFPSPEDIERAEQLKNEGTSHFPTVFRLETLSKSFHRITKCICITKRHLSSHSPVVMMQIKTGSIIDARFNASCT